MKSQLITALSVMLLALPLSSFAASKTSKDITVGTPTTVSHTVLQPGRYKIEWAGNGPAVQVNFMKNGKTLATAPAQVEQTSSPYPEAVETRTEANSTHVLQNIEFKNMTLDFQSANTMPAGE